MRPLWRELTFKFLAKLVPVMATPLSNTHCFIRVSKPSGWVVSTSELVAGDAAHDKSDSKLTLTAHLDVPVAPGTYQLAIATKNPTTGDASVLLTQIKVPTCELLGTKK